MSLTSDTLGKLSKSSPNCFSSKVSTHFGCFLPEICNDHATTRLQRKKVRGTLTLTISFINRLVLYII